MRQWTCHNCGEPCGQPDDFCCPDVFTAIRRECGCGGSFSAPLCDTCQIEEDKAAFLLDLGRAMGFLPEALTLDWSEILYIKHGKSPIFIQLVEWEPLITLDVEHETERRFYFSDKWDDLVEAIQTFIGEECP